MRTRLFVACFALCFAIGALKSANAAPVYSQVDGAGTSNATSTVLSVNTVGGVNVINNSVPGGADSLASVNNSGSLYTLTLTSGTTATLGGANFTLNLTTPHGADTVVFSLSPNASVINPSRIDGTVTLLSNSNPAGYLFHNVGSIWSLSTSFQNWSVQGNGTFSNPNTTGSASWTLTFVADPATQVPEPASMLVWGSMAAAGLFLRRRNRS